MLSPFTTRVDLRSVFSFPVLDQGARPICVPMAVTAAHEIVRANESGPSRKMLAPDALWTHAWQRRLAGLNGTSLLAIGAALWDQGQPHLADWPLDTRIEGASVPPPGAGSPPWMRATLSEQRSDRAALIEKLLSNNPVVLIVHVTDEFHNADPSTGIIHSPDPATAERQGLHAVLCLGFAEGEDTREHFLIRNSWGDAWGVQGYAWLPEDYIDNYCLQMGTVIDVLG